MKRNTDLVSEIIKCCQNREDILAANRRSMSKYNRNLDKMRTLAHQLIAENRQDELLPYLESESVSIREDVACLLYHSYPELCRKTIQEIADMTVATGLPKHLVIVSVRAIDTLKYGIPEDYP